MEQLLTINEMKSRIVNSELASIKTILLELVKLINDPLASAKQLKDLVEIDPPLSTRILKLANSAYYGMAKRISDIQEAIIWIGFDAVKHLALSMKVLELFIGNEIDDFFSRDRLWKFCVTSALAGKLIYRREFKEIGNNIYSLALLHNIGIIMIDQFQPQHFMEILKEFRLKESNMFEIEKKVLGYDHAHLASEIMKEWDFNERFYLPVKFHHQPLLAPHHVRKEATILYIIDQLCTDNDFGFSDIVHFSEFTYKSSLKLYDLDQTALDSIIESVKEDLERMEQLGWF
jgi:HD-like signal output (HDOD) protein